MKSHAQVVVIGGGVVGCSVLSNSTRRSKSFPARRPAGRAFVVEAIDADVIGDEAIWFDGTVRGWVTSGGYAHNAGKSIAMGYVPKEIAGESDGFEIEVMGKRLPARIQPTPLFDANFERMRG